jgi:hypothetical protein
MYAYFLLQATTNFWVQGSGFRVQGLKNLNVGRLPKIRRLGF